MEPIPRRSIRVPGAEEAESLFLLVLSCPVEGGWELLKQRVSTCGNRQRLPESDRTRVK
jgi:hypothetical protein